MSATILDLIDKYYLFELAEKVEKKDACHFGKTVEEPKEKLFAELNEHQIAQVKHLEWEIRAQEDFIRYELQVFLLNYAFRLGMEMQQAFDKADYES